MKQPKYQINNLEFTSDKALQLEITNRLKKYKLGENLTQHDFVFMKDFFEELHEYWKLKTIDGLKGMRVKRNRRGRAGSKSIVLINNRNDEIEISYTISKIKQRDYDREFREVMREVIRPQIRKFRTDEFRGRSKLICPITNSEFSIEQSEVDHKNPTFEDMIKDFIQEQSIDINLNLFPKPEEFDGTYKLTNRRLMEKFSTYHSLKCNLQVLSKDGHKIKTSGY